MRIGSRLRSLTFVIILLLLLSGWCVVEAEAEIDVGTESMLTGKERGSSDPQVAGETSAALSSSTTSTPLPSPLPLATAFPLNPTTSGPDTPPSSTESPGNPDSASTKPSQQTDDQAAHTVRFDPADGSKPTQATVKTGTLVSPPKNNPVRDGFRFDGWTHDGQLFEYQTPILQETTLKAKWTKITDWTLDPDHGPASGARLTISPPDRQEPYYTSFHTAGSQVFSLTGDGRIYVWAQDGTQKQVPFPAQAPDRFHYLQAAAGSQWQAALGSDKQIYIWASQQPTPTILDTDRNIRFTSISTGSDKLLAVDQQGCVHIFQASQADSQNMKLTEQSTISLPGKAQAIIVAASPNRTLIVDADGQDWAWKPGQARNMRPSPIMQDQGVRIIQTAALNQGLLLLDADGQALYLDDSTTSAKAVNLPESMKASRISASNDQAIITDKGGRLWSWKPGEELARADNGNQHYVQAAATGDRVIALDRQGDIFTWILNKQGQPGKPTRINADTAPTLQSASMSGQALAISKKDDTWQVDAPAHKPGQAIIAITGRQDGQPFTKNLKYTVDQPLLRDVQQYSTHTVTFNTAGGSQELEPQKVNYPYGRVKRPSPDPTRAGYQFYGWFIDKVAYDFSKPVTKDLRLTAHWSSNKWAISPDTGSQIGGETTTITPPTNTNGIKFNQISSSKTGSFSLAVGSDGNAYAWGDNTYGQLGDGTAKNSRSTPVMVKKPDQERYPDLPADFTYVQVSAGGRHSLALGSDGYVYAWGNNGFGQLGNNTTSSSNDSNHVPVRVRDPGSPTDESKGLKAIQVSAGYWHSLALDSDGNTYAWGYNWYGQLGNNISGRSEYSSFPVQVRDPDSPADASKGLQAIQISAGNLHSLALGSNGYVYAWGWNSYGQLGDNTNDISEDSHSAFPVRAHDPDNPSDASMGLKATQISAGYNHSLAVGSDGYAYAWGWNIKGQLGNNTTNDSYSGNPFPARVRDPASPTDTSKGLKATQVSAGYWHSLALDSDGNTYAWGYNSSGQLGNNMKTDSYVPTRVRDPASPTDTSKGLKATQVSAGYWHSLALDSDGNTYAWGNNGNGQLGDGTTNNKLAPVQVAFNMQPVITAARFDTSSGTHLIPASNSNSVTVLTPPHQPGLVTVSVDYTMGGAGNTLTDTSLRYMYTPAGVLPRAGGEGIVLALTTGITGMGGVLASRRQRRETRRLLHISHE